MKRTLILRQRISLDSLSLRIPAKREPYLGHRAGA